MVNEVNKIIYNTLMSERAVTLPGVGTLSVVRGVASMQSKDVVTAPVLTVEFSSHGEARSVVDVIASEGGVDAARAEDIYTRWLDKVRNGSVLTIEGVGVLRNKSFGVDKELFTLLNPSQKSVKIKYRKNRTAIAAALVSAFVGVAIMFGVAAWFFYCEDAPVPVEDACVDVVAEECVQIPAVEVEEEVTVVEDVECEFVEGVMEEIAPAVEDWTMHDDIRHWVVAGSYSTRENADVAVENIVKRNGDMKCKVFKLGKMHAVAVFGSVEHGDCEQFMREHKELKQMWIFTPKEYR